MCAMSSDNADPYERILAAAGRCIVARGDTQIRMGEVAAEAGVVRSTLYRYFPTRDELLLGLVLARIDTALARLVDGLRFPDDPVRCLPRMVLEPVGSVDGSPLNVAMFAGESTALTAALELGSERIVDVILRHYDPLFARWQESGAMYPDLDRREVARWTHTVALLLLSTAWRGRSAAAKRRFVDQFVVRTVVSQIGH